MLFRSLLNIVFLLPAVQHGKPLTTASLTVVLTTQYVRASGTSFPPSCNSQEIAKNPTIPGRYSRHRRDGSPCPSTPSLPCGAQQLCPSSRQLSFFSDRCAKLLCKRIGWRNTQPAVTPSAPAIPTRSPYISTPRPSAHRPTCALHDNRSTLQEQIGRGISDGPVDETIDERCLQARLSPLDHIQSIKEQDLLSFAELGHRGLKFCDRVVVDSDRGPTDAEGGEAG